ncbi:hypothetical protein J2Y45_002142 [Dyadobacter sp. BE34]|uniref:Uncharacterized protein n=1 Tax=Dyadobacter fermentans TaxID=94254 RepID=A0ABU1QWL2_9BACT|nr:MULTISPECIES: hypothetical protein [Dyadobacter]MDR6805549.1 hypothetical protein [Dyadobacter fermentans]MDR7042691.1 hypothetical protein [Dyadobacter sp. BE242]MDR7197003.1 hypothetical protein [Dyadobacter sp. BE34]MDR7215562.1 hypothetical protein [Dyadobacter sp. BE31]MDR7263098.1 hypothetical protein [Dyadobacter sp. BE32]
MEDCKLLIATPEFFARNLNTSGGLIRIITTLNEAYCSYLEQRVGGTGVVNDRIDVYYVTGFMRDLMEIITETLFKEGGVPSVFEVDARHDIFMRGPETLIEVLNIVDDIFDSHIRSPYFECPRADFLETFCGLRRGINDLVSNVHLALVAQNPRKFFQSEYFTLSQSNSQ